MKLFLEVRHSLVAVNCSAWGLCLLLASSLVLADGTITHLSGQVTVQKADGQQVAAVSGSKVGKGDSLLTGTSGYARLEMTDGGEMVLRPNSQIKVDEYRFDKEKPKEDSFVFNVLKGGLRTVTGLIGKRGNKDAYELKTMTTTVGIRGTQFDLRVCQASCGALADGTYLAVRFGAVQTSNAQGSLAVAAGQVAHVPPQSPPVMLPRDPGVGFTPPPVIPKLDEKKKQEAAKKDEAAAAQKPQPAADQKKAPDAGKPADSKDEKKSDEKKPEGKDDKKPDGKTDSKSEGKAEAKAEVKTEAKAEVKAEAPSSQKTDSAASAGSKAVNVGAPAPVPQPSPGGMCTLQ